MQLGSRVDAIERNWELWPSAQQSLGKGNAWMGRQSPQPPPLRDPRAHDHPNVRLQPDLVAGLEGLPRQKKHTVDESTTSEGTATSTESVKAKVLVVGFPLSQLRDVLLDASQVIIDLVLPGGKRDKEPKLVAYDGDNKFALYFQNIEDMLHFRNQFEAKAAGQYLDLSFPDGHRYAHFPSIQGIRLRRDRLAEVRRKLVVIGKHRAVVHLCPRTVHWRSASRPSWQL